MHKNLAGALAFFLMLLCGLPVRAQNQQPQNNYSAQISAAIPSVNLTFNNPTYPYRENTTGSNFIAPTVTYSAALGETSAATLSATSGRAYINPTTFSSTCTMGTVSIYYYAAPTAGSQTITINSGSGASWTIASSFTVTVAATTGWQTFVAGVGAPSGVSLPAGDAGGFWGSSSTGLPGLLGGTGGYYLAAASSLPSGANTYTATGTPAINFQCATPTGTILSGQAGFDSSQVNNTAVSIPYNSYIYGPNDTLGDIDWTHPFWFVYQIDQLNWARSGTKILLSKGNIGGGNGAKWWYLEITMKTSLVAEFCFVMNGGGSTLAQVIVCTNASTDNRNGYNYTVMVTWDGIGSPASANLYVNGLNSSDSWTLGGSVGFGGITVALGGSGTGYNTTTPFGAVPSTGAGSAPVAFGTITSSSGDPSSVSTTYSGNYGWTSTPTLAVAPYIAAISGSGTGYATSTAFTSTGGGTGCALTGTMTSSGGVPASITTTPSAAMMNCTSAPTIVLTSPTGTGETVTAVATPGSGATLTAALSGNSISTSAIAPLYIGGAWSASGSTSTWSTIAPMEGSDTNSSDSNLLVDQFAMGYGTAATQTLVQGLFYQTKFYQGLLNPVPAVPYTIIYSNDGCADPDNLYALATAIFEQKLGYVRIAGVEDTDTDGQSAAMYRQMMNQAGLAHVPLSIPSQGPSAALCTAANLNTYNSATPQSSSAYITSAAMYRAVFEANPTTPVVILTGGSVQGIYDFASSAAGGLSGLTGQQLMTRNANNGGFINGQGLLPNTTFTTGMGNLSQEWQAAQWLMANNCPTGVCTPWYWYMGTPQNSGPGVLSTRNAKDPMYLFALGYGSDVRPAYDSLPVVNFESTKFAGPVAVTVSGGTGYATTTYGTITGCGPNWSNTPIIVNATSGVPTTVTDLSGLTPIGSGCPYNASGAVSLTGSTGTGATFTVTPQNSGCSTITVTSATNGSTSSSTCTGQYFMWPSVTAYSPGVPVLTWFLNSEIDPPPNPAPRGSN